MGFFEIFMVLIIAIIFLGPDKLPQALIDLAKFFKAVKKTLDDAKTSIDKELNLEELKKEALEYKQTFTQNLEDLNKEIKLSDEIKSLEDFNIHQNNNPQQTIQSPLPQEETPQKTQDPLQNPKDQISPDPSEPSQESVHFVKPKTSFQETSYKDS